MAQYWMLAWKLCDLSEDPDQYYLGTLGGGGGGVSPSPPPLDPHLYNLPSIFYWYHSLHI